MSRSDDKPPVCKETEDARFLESPRPAERQTPQDLLARDSWRVFRIMGEFVEGFEEMSIAGPAVSIFGSARVSPDDAIYQQCVTTAFGLGKEGYSIITGGGPGIMEAANRGAREAGAPSFGCNIELPFEQGTNPFVDHAIDFRYFFVRKTMFVKYADAFVIFPGGYGTMDELFEALTLIQTGKIQNFPVVLFGSDYWHGLFDWIRSTMLEQGRISQADFELVHLTDDPEEVVAHIRNHVQATRAGSSAERTTLR